MNVDLEMNKNTLYRFNKQKSIFLDFWKMCPILLMYQKSKNSPDICETYILVTNLLILDNLSIHLNLKRNGDNDDFVFNLKY